ncbi:MAG: hypothetical protein M3456_05475 [Actinomycetota bacterium]|nr:hypothetical protein [Actinomycetota bacterium]
MNQVNDALEAVDAPVGTAGSRHVVRLVRVSDHFNGRAVLLEDCQNQVGLSRGQRRSDSACNNSSGTELLVTVT